MQASRPGKNQIAAAVQGNASHIERAADNLFLAVGRRNLKNQRAVQIVPDQPFMGRIPNGPFAAEVVVLSNNFKRSHEILWGINCAFNAIGIISSLPGMSRF
jgi:hypothetical protein